MSAGFSMAAMIRAASKSFSHVLRRLIMGTPNQEGVAENRHISLYCNCRLDFAVVLCIPYLQYLD